LQGASALFNANARLKLCQIFLRYQIGSINHCFDFGKLRVIACQNFKNLGYTHFAKYTKHDFPFHVAITSSKKLTGYVMVEQVKSIDYKSKKVKLMRLLRMSFWLKF
jgi:hypothetical protein